jgi:hypothetical protein
LLLDARSTFSLRSLRRDDVVDAKEKAGGLWGKKGKKGKVEEKEEGQFRLYVEISREKKRTSIAVFRVCTFTAADS